jgi:hypothetical protein
MAIQKGSSFCGETLNVANGAYADIRPEELREAVIHNIAYTGAVEFYRYYSTNVKLDYDASAGDWGGDLALHVTHWYYVRVKNVSGGNIDVTWDGVYTK